MIADLIITNARVITIDREKPFADALAIRGNSILRVGSAASVMELKGAITRVHDNKGNTVIPGIIEGHVHLCSTSMASTASMRLPRRFVTTGPAIRVRFFSM